MQSVNNASFKQCGLSFGIVNSFTNFLCQCMQRWCGLSKLAFPYHNYVPSCFFQSCLRTVIPRNVFIKLFLPKVMAAFWDGCIFAVLVSMPKAAVDKYTYTCSGHHNVRATRKIFSVKPETVTFRMQVSPHNYFWFCVSSLDSTHHARSSGFVHDVHFITPQNGLFI